ncbi:Trp biosynthesis-associated membrane protein [Glutamicibacter sp.]|uniref:Trp biosynthesis-associated membrane protein n=1 Tax=Glutamicibacter sp. TaxID=1931995 RepID=UPI002B49096B|nr:Trp biosynthesis-associated membrane protein [Glutamicibacter sp.]HJX79569.1 Trp biosynthesis-associated membrane protein [Glutamicibacter sp.]
MNKHLSARNTALLGVLGALLGLWTATRTWITVDVESGTVQVPQIIVAGSTAAASVTAVCVAVLAGALALLIAGKIARYIIGVITVLAGASVITSGISALANPQAAAASAVAEATGLTTSAGDYAVSAWPAITVLAGAVIVLQGLLVLVISGRWKKSSKYDRKVDTAGQPPADAQSRGISDWEQLSKGEDPTTGER